MAGSLPQAIPTSPIRFALWCSRGCRNWGIVAIFAVFLGSLLSLAQHYIIQELTNAAASVDLAVQESVRALWFWAIAYPALGLISQLTWRCSGFSGMRWVTRTGAAIYEELFGYLSRHSTGYFSDRFAGALSNKISNAASGVEALQAKFLWEFLTVFFSVLGSLYLAYTAHIWLAGLMGLWLLLFTGLNVFAVARLRGHSHRYAESTSELKGKIVDSTSNIDVVHQSGQVSYEEKYVQGFIDSMRRAHLRIWTAFEWVLVFNSVLLAVFNCLILLAAVYLLEHNTISVGALVMMITLIVGLQRQLFFIGHVMAEAMREYGQVQEGLEELLLPHEIRDAPDACSVTIQKGEIEFQDVEFAYDSQPVFEGFNLKIPAGQKVGLVGASGVGKSTLVSLLLRQYEVDSGLITIDTTAIASMTLESLRKNIALVPQSTSLFHRTISENIRYGRLTASDTEVELAARKAQAHTFIEAYPERYKTFVGERGVKLSGGQRQRIAIARAILKDAPILVLDEATSALDSESESAIQLALEQLMENKTVLAIAHRLSTLRAMDRIIVLDGGKIVEDGSHEQLLAAEGMYHRLWNRQVHGFVGSDAA